MPPVQTLWAPSYSTLAVREAGAVADEAERKKKVKYAHLENSHHFVPVAVETLGVFGSEARSFFKDLGGRIKAYTYIGAFVPSLRLAKDQCGSAARQHSGHPRLPPL